MLIVKGLGTGYSGSGGTGLGGTSKMYPERIGRILRLVTLLRSRRYYSGQELAEKLEVSKRTVYRDLNVLEAAGIPCYHDENSGGYHILDSFFLPPVSFTLEETLSLLMLVEGQKKAQGFPFMLDAARAFQKIESLLPSGIQKEVAALCGNMEINLGPMTDLRDFDSVYMTVREAIKNRQVLTCLYKSLFDKKTVDIELEPYTLFFSKRSWYVAGHSSLDHGVRMFKLNRFEKLEPIDRRYTIPTDYCFDRLIGNAWNMIRGEKTYDVKIYFSPGVADNIVDTIWHSTQKMVRTNDGGVEMSVTVDGLNEIVWWVLGYGEYAKVLEPKELIDRITASSQKILQTYSTCEGGN